MRFSRPWLRARALAAAALFLASAAGAQTRVQIPRPTGYVNDFANVLDPASEAAIQGVIDDVRTKSRGAEIVVVTLPSLGGRAIDDVALELGRQWGVGSRGQIGDSLRNVGTLILVAPTERRVRIEVSEGANNFLTAAETGRIQDQYMVPYFRQGDFATGLRQGVIAVAQAYARQFGFQLDPSAAAQAPPPVQEQPRPPRRRTGIPPMLWIFLLFMVLSFIGRGGGGGGRGGRRRRRGWGGPIIIPFPMGGGGWGGGGFGGGGGGGGFGGFGGGGGWSGGGSDRGW